MSNCLGLYIEEHLIKYAKVSKDHDNIKVETFGVMFYDKISDAIKQIVEKHLLVLVYLKKCITTLICFLC